MFIQKKLSWSVSLEEIMVISDESSVHWKAMHI